MLLEERVNLIHLKLGLEVREMLVGKAVGATAGIGEAETLIHDFFAGASPVMESIVSKVNHAVDQDQTV